MNKIKAILTIFLLTSQILLPESGYCRKRLIIDNVYLDKKVLNLNKDKEVKINFRLSQDADVELMIYDELNQNVFFNKKAFKKGKAYMIWNGLDNYGKKVFNGAYTYILKALNEQNRFTFNPASRTAGRDLELKTYFIDSRKNRIEYVLSKAAWVRLRVGLKDGPLFDTLLDWTPEPGGRNLLSWDGWTKDRAIDIAKHPDRSLSIQAISLPSNCIIVKGGNEKDRYKNLLLIEQGKINFIYPVPLRSEIFVPEPSVNIEFPEDIKTSEQGEIIVSDKLKIRVKLNPEDEEKLTNARFEIMFYVDNIFVYEDEQAYTPYNYEWDLSGVSEGVHILNINILGYNKTVGSRNIMINVKR